MAVELPAQSLSARCRSYFGRNEPWLRHLPVAALAAVTPTVVGGLVDGPAPDWVRLAVVWGGYMAYGGAAVALAASVVAAVAMRERSRSAELWATGMVLLAFSFLVILMWHLAS